MATITKRGDYQFQAIIRRKGFPSQTKTFESRADAERWAREVEATCHQGVQGPTPGLLPGSFFSVRTKFRFRLLQPKPQGRQFGGHQG